MKEHGENMFDIEHPNRKCLNNQCDFLEEFMIELDDERVHRAYKCSLTIQDRVKKCPIHLKELKRLDIPNYHKLYEIELNEYDRLSKTRDNLDETIRNLNHKVSSQYNEINSLKKKMDEYDYLHERYNRFHQRILDDTKSLIVLRHDRDEYRSYVESLRRMVQEVNKEVE